MSDYWKNIKTASKTLSKGLKVTFSHIKDARTQRDPLYVDNDNYFVKQNGLITTQYPKESIPVPDHGRYKLHNEIDDCIVCDKCAKVCPVNCIDIEPVRAVEEFGKTSDGTSKRIYAAKFDIDMAKCCFCGLCTTVCPTECLTMTNEYDFSAYDFEEHNIPFGEMTPLEILEKKKEFELFQQKKAAEKEAAKQVSTGDAKPKVAFKPKMKVAVKPKPVTSNEEGAARPKPVMRPKVQVKPKITPDAEKESDSPTQKPKPVIRPKVVVKKKEEGGTTEKKPRPVMRPKIQPKPKMTPRAEKEEGGTEQKASRPKPVMRPKIKPRPKPDSDDSTTNPDKE